MSDFPAAMTGGLFRVRAGIKPAIGGTVLGTLLRYTIYVQYRGTSQQRVIRKFSCIAPCRYI